MDPLATNSDGRRVRESDGGQRYGEKHNNTPSYIARLQDGRVVTCQFLREAGQWSLVLWWQRSSAVDDMHNDMMAGTYDPSRPVYVDCVERVRVPLARILAAVYRPADPTAAFEAGRYHPIVHLKLVYGGVDLVAFSPVPGTAERRAGQIQLTLAGKQTGAEADGRVSPFWARLAELCRNGQGVRIPRPVVLDAALRVSATVQPGGRRVHIRANRGPRVGRMLADVDVSPAFILPLVHFCAVLVHPVAGALPGPSHGSLPVGVLLAWGRNAATARRVPVALDAISGEDKEILLQYLAQEVGLPVLSTTKATCAAAVCAQVCLAMRPAFLRARNVEPTMLQAGAPGGGTAETCRAVLHALMHGPLLAERVGAFMVADAEDLHPLADEGGQ